MSNPTLHDIPRVRLAIAISGLGMIGVGSLMLLPVETMLSQPLPVPVWTVKLQMLLIPILLVLIAAFVGAFVAPSLGLQAPAIAKTIRGGSPVRELRQQFLPGLCGAILVAALLLVHEIVSQSLMTNIENNGIRKMVPEIPALVRILYGGISEEIIARWGLMTAIVWSGWRLSGRPATVSAQMMWFGVSGAAVLFAVSHLPALFTAVGAPPTLLVIETILANTIGGLIFGWLFWRRGLETAIFAHGGAHMIAITMVSLGVN